VYLLSPVHGTNQRANPPTQDVEEGVASVGVGGRQCGIPRFLVSCGDPALVWPERQSEEVAVEDSGQPLVDARGLPAPVAVRLMHHFGSVDHQS